MHHFATEMCPRVHISITKWYIVGYLPDALWDLWDGWSQVEMLWWDDKSALYEVNEDQILVWCLSSDIKLLFIFQWSAC